MRKSMYKVIVLIVVLLGTFQQKADSSIFHARVLNSNASLAAVGDPTYCQMLLDKITFFAGKMEETVNEMDTVMEGMPDSCNGNIICEDEMAAQLQAKGQLGIHAAALYVAAKGGVVSLAVVSWYVGMNLEEDWQDFLDAYYAYQNCIDVCNVSFDTMDTLVDDFESYKNSFQYYRSLFKGNDCEDVLS